MMCMSIPAVAAKRDIFLTMEPPPFSSCHRLRLLDPTTITFSYIAQEEPEKSRDAELRQATKPA